MKNVLLPSDLSVQSLWPAKKLIQGLASGSKLNIYLLHILEMPTGISDLLFIGRRKNIPTPTAFKDALQVLQNKKNNAEVNFYFDFIYGNSKAVLKNYIEAKGINEVFMLDGYTYKFSNSESVDFIPMLKKITTPVNYVNFQQGVYSEFQVLSILLNNDEKEEAEQKEVIDISFNPAAIAV